ncbi:MULTISPECIES: type VI secretion system Vgr family protein [Burkholderia]|uniref:Type VI secretion system Vgr family protein n=1 Tax=Burkholderia sola TaxID=2843302 RepID=A0ABV2C9W6_9BURK|nr:type VI secretion system Vgr family protein [Burkholderia sp. CpTa8-5]MBP0607890.1 type VI secretion system tip protein VgrG [Burkholderia sp. CpTa8-5]
MAEFDRVTSYLTGRQSAHLTLMRRKSKRDPETGELPPMPTVSVVSWVVREAICEPYSVKAVVAAPVAIPRKTVLGQLAKFSVRPEDGRAKREFAGFVTQFDSVSESRDGYTYRIVMRQHLAVMDGPSNCATYQGMASWEIIKEILARYDLRFWIQVEFNLRREHPRHPFRFQYNMGDWDYVKLEMEQAGLYCYTRTGEHGDVLVIADDVDGYMRPAIPVLDRPTAGLATFEESIFSFKVRSRVVPESYVVADYNPEQAWERFRAEDRAVSDDETMIGKPYVWGTHHDDAKGAKREAQLRHEAARASQIRYSVESTVLAIRPGSIVQSDRTLEDAGAAMFVTTVVHRGARNASYVNSFTAIPADRPYRLEIDERRWPKIPGTLGATITSPDRYKFAYLTDKGEYVARFHCDFGNWPKGGESVPLRLAKPFAGRNHTGMHMPALDGDEALIGFREGNPNKPFIASFIHNSERPDLINSSRRRMSRNEIRTQSGNTFWMDDWDNQEGIELGTQHSGRSQLHLGHMVDRALNQRGAGAELRTSGHAVARGGAGVMVTAYDRPGGAGKQLDMAETIAQLKDMLALAESLAKSAEASKASPADTQAQKAIGDGLDELKRPGAVVTAPGPVGVVSGDGVQLAADGSIIGTAKKGVHFSALKRITAAAGGQLSLFARKGMSLIASAGEVIVQAQRGRMQLAAQEDMTVETVNGVLHVKSPKEILLSVGGSYIRVNPEGIEMGSRGRVHFRTSGLKKTGPAQLDLSGAAFAPAFVPFKTECEVWRTNPNFVQAPALAPEPSPPQWESQGNREAVARALAPAADGGKLSDFSPFDGKPSNVDSNVPKAKVELNGPDDQTQSYVAPDPIKLANAVPCDWKITDLKVDVRQHIEAKPYWGMLDNRTPWKDSSGNQIRGGGSRDSNFEFAYSEQDKTITCTVRVMLVPMDLFPVDVTGNRDLTVSPQTVPYEATTHWRMMPGSTVKGVKMDYRDTVGDKYDVDALRNRIEAVLNQRTYKLILDGCSKGAACGCRVKVNFRVDLRVSVRGAPIAGFKPHVTNHLYPTVLRADTSSWGEGQKWQDDRGEVHDSGRANVEAHECGHYFNFPDEYYDRGGWLHESYIKCEQIDFSLVDAKAGTMMWQARSPTNLMGYGANSSWQIGKVTATIKPYYLEYVRRQFSLATNKLWRVGYDS